MEVISKLFVASLLLSMFSSGNGSSESWTAAEIDEGPCHDPLPDPVIFNTEWVSVEYRLSLSALVLQFPILTFILFQLIAALKSGWYVTMASRLYLYSTSNLIYGKAAANTADLDTLCLQFTPATPMASITGYYNKSVRSCSSQRIGTQDCEVVVDDDVSKNTTKNLRMSISGMRRLSLILCSILPYKLICTFNRSERLVILV
jgi:hypothetical protein